MVDDDGRTDDDGRRTPDHGHPISSPCDPNGSGELITRRMKFCCFLTHFSIDVGNDKRPIT